VTEKKEINEKNIDALIPDKASQVAVIKPYAGSAESQYIKNLQSADDIELHYDKIGSNNKNVIIFKVGDISFTEANLEKLLDLNLNMMKSDPRIEKLPTITLEQKRIIVQNEFFYYLLKRDADNKGLTKDPAFIKLMATEKENRISAEYVRQYTKDIKVTESEMRQVFKENTEKPSEQEYQNSKNEIRMGLLLKKKGEKAEQLRADLKNTYAFKVYENKLK
jgi:hypothetical protein